MSRKSVLLVDTDSRSLRVLEVSLKRAGFTVVTAESGGQALSRALEHRPDLVITDTVLGDIDGFELCTRLKSDPRHARLALLFLSSDPGPDAKVKGINAGADEMLSKPTTVMEIVSRAKNILERRETDSITRHGKAGSMSGALANMSVVDLLQLMETGQKTGIVYVASDPARSGGYVVSGEERGTIYFRDGRVIDAKVGALEGAGAVFRLLLWEDGVFEVEFKPLAREDIVGTTTQAILLEGMRRLDEWSQVSELLPPLHARLYLDATVLDPRASDAQRQIAALFDGTRSIFEVVDTCASDDLMVLSTIAELVRARVLRVQDPSARATLGSDASSVEAWLDSTAPSMSIPIPSAIPSALARATIPSRETASQILRGANADGTSDAPYPLTRSLGEHTPIPVPLPDESLVLRRQTVPANRPTQVPAASEAIAMSATPERTGDINITQKLSVQRVQSSVLPRATIIEEHAHHSAPPSRPPPPSQPPRHALPPPPPPRGVSATGVPTIDVSQVEVTNIEIIQPTTKEVSGLHDSFFKRQEDESASNWAASANAGRFKGVAFGVGAVLALLAAVWLSSRVRQQHVTQRGEAIEESAPAAKAVEKRVPVAVKEPVRTATIVLEMQPVVTVVETKPAETKAAEAKIETKPMAVAPVVVDMATTPPAVDTKKVVEQGESALKSGNMKEAEKRFKAALEVTPGDPKVYSGLAMAFYELGKDSAASSAAKTAIDLDPNEARAYLVLGSIALAKDPAAAKRAYQRYLELAPKSKDAAEIRKIADSL